MKLLVNIGVNSFHDTPLRYYALHPHYTRNQSLCQAQNASVLLFPENLRKVGIRWPCGVWLLRCVAHLTRPDICGKITTMKTQTVKIWKGTLKKLRMIYALTGENMVSIMERLVAAELEQIQQANSDENSSSLQS